MSIDFPKEEEAIIEKWREIKAFERQVSTRLGAREASLLGAVMVLKTEVANCPLNSSN